MSCLISSVHCGNPTSPKLDLVRATSREPDRNQFPPGSHDFQFRNSGLALLGGAPGNAILLNGVMKTANLEIDAPGFQPQVPTSTSEFRINIVVSSHPAEANALKVGWKSLTDCERA